MNATTRLRKRAIVPTAHPEEEWRWVAGFENLYEVSNLGRIRSWYRRGNSGGLSDSPSVRKPTPTPKGYLLLSLRKDGVPSTATVHRLVAEAFLGARPEAHVIRHMDGDPGNNRADNLRYGTSVENSADQRRHGTHSRGTAAARSVLTVEDVHAIRRLYAEGTLSARGVAKHLNLPFHATATVLTERSWTWLETPGVSPRLHSYKGWASDV